MKTCKKCGKEIKSLSNAMLVVIRKKPLDGDLYHKKCAPVE